MKKIAFELLKKANDLDDLKLYTFAENIENIAKDLIVESEMTPVPSKQPQIQSEPIQQVLKNRKKTQKKNIDQSKNIKIEKLQEEIQ